MINTKKRLVSATTIKKPKREKPAYFTLHHSPYSSNLEWSTALYSCCLFFIQKLVILPAVKSRFRKKSNCFQKRVTLEALNILREEHVDQQQ